MPYLPCRGFLTEVRPARRPRRLAWRLSLALVAVLVALPACGKAPPDPRREKYNADKARCEAGSTDEAARKSCMTYRGWPEGKFR